MQCKSCHRFFCSDCGNARPDQLAAEQRQLSINNNNSCYRCCCCLTAAIVGGIAGAAFACHKLQSLLFSLAGNCLTTIAVVAFVCIRCYFGLIYVYFSINICCFQLAWGNRHPFYASQ